ncbi:tetratricopeptide repeat protein [Paenibacillus sp. N3.4]|uniref:tetratricopeptide repeat protein n=1 Tax=Paenibacillus sp. N3.4 TaxID=2603222 RepID=UPI0011C85DB7|nr:tetratricopeptide repeat protein [Paenibacillus sp. N3.4]TXK76767.1 tetratricopeptide repeat protein [Paenibacillus sp. N3.4]
MMTGYRIQLLGTFQCFYNDKPFERMLTTRQQLLFAYFLLHPDIPINRKHLAFMFWPDTSEPQALTNLRKLIYDLRKCLPISDTFLEMNGSQITWHSLEQCSVDALDFNQMAESVEIADLKRAIASYQGELLPGHDEEWVLELREKLSFQYAVLLKRIITICENKRDFHSALDYSIRYLHLDRYSESAHVRVANLYACNHNLSAAYRQFEEMKTMLSKELGVLPSVDTMEKFNQLSTIARSATVRENKMQVPFVGREHEWNRLLECWDKAMRDRSMLVVLDGEAGIGKTRLAEEFGFWAQIQGIRVYTSFCYSSDSIPIPHEPLVSWLEQADLQHMDTAGLVEMSRMLPKLKEQYPELPPPAPLSENWQIRIWHQANLDALSGGKSTILILNDLQWVDKETLHLLSFFLRPEHSSALMMICTLRTGEGFMPDHVREFIDAHRYQNKLAQIGIPFLSKQETKLLAASLHQSKWIAAEIAQLYEETQGNPLYIGEVVRSIQFNTRHESYGTTILYLMIHRLAMLPPSYHPHVHLLTILGKPAPIPFLTGNADLPDQAADHIEALIQSRILSVTDHGMVDFYHKRMREASMLRMNRSVRLAWHQVAAKAMMQHENERYFTFAEIAYQLENAGLHLEATEYYMKAIEEAKRVCAHDTIIEYGSSALRAANPEQKFKLLSSMAHAYRMTGRWLDMENTYRILLQQSEHAVPLELKTMYEVGLANCLRLQGKYLEALDYLEKCLHRFELLNDSKGLAETCGNLGLIHQYLGNFEVAARFLQQNIELNPEGSENERFIVILGNLLYDQDRFEESIHTFKRQIQLASERHNRIDLAKALGGIGLNFLETQQFDRAYTSFCEKLEVSRLLGDRMGMAISIGLIGKWHMKVGFYQEAHDCLLYCLDEALRIGDMRVVGIMLGLIGHTFGERDKENEALWILQQAEHVTEYLNVPFFVCDTYYYRAYFELKRKRWQEAEVYIDRALNLSAKLNRSKLHEALSSFLILCQNKTEDSIVLRTIKHVETAPVIPNEASSHSRTFAELQESITALRAQKHF